MLCMQFIHESHDKIAWCGVQCTVAEQLQTGDTESGAK